MANRSEIEAKLRGYPLLEEKVQRYIASMQGLVGIPPGWSGIDYSGGIDYTEGSPRNKALPPQGDNLMSSGIEEYVVESLPSPAMIERIREYERMNHIFMHLHSHERELIRVKYWKGLTDVKTATWLGCTTRTVINRKNRLIDRLIKLGL